MEFYEVLCNWIKNKGCCMMKIWLGTGGVAQWYSICLVCVRPQVQSLVPQKEGKIPPNVIDSR